MKLPFKVQGCLTNLLFLSYQSIQAIVPCRAKYLLLYSHSSWTRFGSLALFQGQIGAFTLSHFVYKLRVVVGLDSE